MKIKDYIKNLSKKYGIVVAIPASASYPYLLWKVMYKRKGIKDDETTEYIGYEEGDGVEEEYITSLRRSKYIDGRILDVELVDNNMEEVEDAEDWKEHVAEKLFQKQVKKLQMNIRTYLNKGIK